jgi:hypothetical protein
MNIQQFLVLGLILIVIMLLFSNNGRESFECEGEEKKMQTNPQINFADIFNKLESVLCLIDTCSHCQKFKNMTVEQTKDEFKIPKYIKLKVPHNKELQTVFENFEHDGMDVNAKTYPSKVVIDEIEGLRPIYNEWYKRFKEFIGIDNDV